MRRAPCWTPRRQATAWRRLLLRCGEVPRSYEPSVTAGAPGRQPAPPALLSCALPSSHSLAALAHNAPLRRWQVRQGGELHQRIKRNDQGGFYQARAPG